MCVSSPYRLQHYISTHRITKTPAQIGNAGAFHLARLRKLTKLGLGDTDVGDGAVLALTGLVSFVFYAAAGWLDTAGWCGPTDSVCSHVRPPFPFGCRPTAPPPIRRLTTKHPFPPTKRYIKQSRLTSLNLDARHISDEALTLALPLAPHLKELDLYSCRVREPD